MKKHFPGPEETFIIFDGYLQPSTKDKVHGIRNPIASLEVDVAFDNVVDCKQELLLSNPINKHKFIGLLMEGLEEGLYHESQCVADADSYFVQQAMELSESSHVCVVAENTDILIMILEKMPTSTAEFYCRQQTVDRVMDAGSNIMIAMYAILEKLPDTSLLTLNKLRHKLFLSSLYQKKAHVQKKGRSQTAPSNFLGCEVSLPPGASSNTGVAVQSSRSV